MPGKIRVPSVLVLAWTRGRRSLRSHPRGAPHKMGSFGDHLGVIWDHFGIILGSFGDHSGIILGSFGGHSGFILARFWGDRISPGEILISEILISANDL